MNKNRFFAVLGGVCLLLALVLVGLTRRDRAPAATTSDAAMLAALERMEAAQQRQDERLARLESRIAPSGAAPASSVPAGPNTVGGNANQSAAAFDPGRSDLRRDAQMRALEERLVADPYSAKWATSNEQAVGRFLSSANLAREKLPAPSAAETRCQSHLCRIRLTFADAEQADRTQSSLLMEISPGLPSAMTFVVPRPDGQVDMVIYAGQTEHVR